MSWYQYPTNYSNGTMVDGVGKFFFQYPSVVASGWFGAAIVLLIFFISFFTSMAVGARKSMAVAGFISLIFAVYLTRLDMIHPVIIITLIIIMIIGIIGGSKDTNL